MYYCLIASLEQYTLASDARKIDFAELRTEIEGELSPTDHRAVDLLGGYYDVVNILTAISGNDLPHNGLGKLTKEQIDEEIHYVPSDDEPRVSLLPTSVRYALDLIKGNIEIDEDAPVDLSDVERLLFENFYTECAASKCAYLREFVDIDRQMRNVIAGAELPIGQIDDQIKERSWWVPLHEVLATADFVEREHKMDALRWKIAEELTEPGGLDENGHYFDIAVVLNYVIKLNILQRWAMLSSERGAHRFKRLVASFVEQGRINE